MIFTTGRSDKEISVQLMIRAIDNVIDVLWENHGKDTYINLGSRWTPVLHLVRELQYILCRWVSPKSPPK
jgi:hypothetical protein